MKSSQLLSRGSKIAPFAFFFLTGGTAEATQPLQTFLEGGRTVSFEAREQTATIEQRGWEKDAALGRLLPSLTARGVYTHNQYEAVLPAGAAGPGSPALTIVPQNQLDAFFQLDVPLIDLANYYRYRQAAHFAKAAEAGRELSTAEVDKAVSRSYYTFVAASALVGAADRSLGIAEANLANVSTRFAAGVATELDRERARANVERAKQDRADAEFVRTMAARTLETLTGVSPTAVTEYPVDDHRVEAPLDQWLAHRDTPNDRVQEQLNEASVAAKKAAAFSLLPTLSANAQERITNATGFTGQASTYTLQAILSWRLDYSTYASAQAQASAADIQKIRAERTRRSTEDGIFEAHKRVETSISKSASARAQAEAAMKAEKLATARYQAGALTQLEVTQAQRDAFQAHAARIQADTDLAYARVALRLAAGQAPDVPPSSLPPVAAEDLEASLTAPPPVVPAAAPAAAPSSAAPSSAAPPSAVPAPSGAVPATPGASAPTSPTGVPPAAAPAPAR